MKNHFRSILLAATAALVLGTAPLINWGAARAQTSAVMIQNFSFQPGTLTVPVGATVNWTNTDSTEHTVTSDSGLFDSGALSQNGTFSHTFASAGSFTYHCAIHTNMTGTINVTSSSAPTATSTSAAIPTNTSTTGATAVPTDTSPAATDTPAPTDTDTPIPPAPKKLSLHASPSAVTAGKSTTISLTVKKSGSSSAVKGAAITLDGRSVGLRSLLHAKSDAHGKATFKSIHPSRRGSIHVSATKSGFKAAKATIKVR
jgi:plastocyanin